MTPAALLGPALLRCSAVRFLVAVPRAHSPTPTPRGCDNRCRTRPTSPATSRSCRYCVNLPSPTPTRSGDRRCRVNLPTPMRTTGTGTTGALGRLLLVAALATRFGHGLFFLHLRGLCALRALAGCCRFNTTQSPRSDPGAGFAERCESVVVETHFTAVSPKNPRSKKDRSTHCVLSTRSRV